MAMRAKGLVRDISCAFVAGGLADAVCQMGERSMGGVKKPDWDWTRSFAFSTFTGFYIGGVCTGIFATYPRIASRILKAKPGVAPKLEGAIATALDNFVHVPLMYIPSFYMGTGLLKGEEPEAVVENLRENWTDTVLSCWCFWIPAQFVIFSAVPPVYRVRSVAMGDFIWNVALSYIAHRPSSNTGREMSSGTSMAVE